MRTPMQPITSRTFISSHETYTACGNDMGTGRPTCLRSLAQLVQACARRQQIAADVWAGVYVSPLPWLTYQSATLLQPSIVRTQLKVIRAVLSV